MALAYFGLRICPSMRYSIRIEVLFKIYKKECTRLMNMKQVKQILTVGKLGFTCVEKGNIDRNEKIFFFLFQPLCDIRISGRDIMVISVKVR